jgi:heptaprenyl diphosphate synthase
MDFEETKDAAKKPVQSDYEQNVITLPLIHALKNLSDFRLKAKEQKLSREEINKAVKETGGLNYTRFIAGRYYDKSLELILTLNLTADKAEKLKMLLDRSYRLIS